MRLRTAPRGWRVLGMGTDTSPPLQVSGEEVEAGRVRAGAAPVFQAGRPPPGGGGREVASARGGGGPGRDVAGVVTWEPARAAAAGALGGDGSAAWPGGQGRTGGFGTKGARQGSVHTERRGHRDRGTERSKLDVWSTM